jgi:hypothetical protein
MTMHGSGAAFGGAALCAALIIAGTTRAAELPELNKVDRRIAREPAYKARQPLYGLYLFGPQGKTRVWAVLDKSKPDARDYDVLYFDRNADGDLTGRGERIEGKVAGDSVTFAVGTFTDPLSKQEHTDLMITVHGGASARVMLSMKWCGKVEVRGGYAAQPGPYTQFASTTAEAPVLWPAADGPFSFQLWDAKPLTIGGANDVRVFLGHRGHGKNTFCAVPDTFLPRDVPVLATLVYKDSHGKEQRAQSELRERC